MDAFLTQLGRHLADRWRAQRQPRTLRAFRCLCSAPVFFRNSGCLSCGRALGYDPAQRLLLALDVRGEALIEARPASALHLRGARQFHRCANAVSAANCNWLVPDEERNGAGERPLFCVACRLNRVIPDQTLADNQRDWAHCLHLVHRVVTR